MAVSVAMKRPAEDLMDHSSTDLDSMKLLNAVVPPRGAKKRKDTLSCFVSPSANDYTEDDYTEDLSSHGAEILNGSPEKKNPEQLPGHGKQGNLMLSPPKRSSTPENATAPRTNGFPCIWLSNTSPNSLMRNTEEMDKSPPPTQLPPPLIGGNTFPNVLPNITSSSDSPAISKLSPSSNIPSNLFSSDSLLKLATQSEGSPRLSKSQMKSLMTSGIQSHSDSEAGDGEAAEVCPECRKVFKRKVYLQRHMEREHWSTAKVFKCDDCSYETKHQSNLSVHRRTHTGERPYHCGCCGQRYTQGHLLKSHIRSRHGGNMEFYNLDKKSESTRGRKSLDIKHDGLLGGHKQDKISALLQAAATGNATPNGSGSANLSGSGKFGNLLSPSMSPYMNTLSPFFSPLRPMMTNPMSLLGGARGLFGLGGMPGNGFPTPPHSALLPPMQQTLPLLSSQTSMSSLGTAPVSKSQEKNLPSPTVPPSSIAIKSEAPAAMKIPLKVPESGPNHSSSSLLPQDLSLPQDLTTKKVPAEADVVPGHLPASETQSEPSACEPQDLTSHPRMSVAAAASPARPQESDTATIPSPHREESPASFGTTIVIKPEAPSGEDGCVTEDSEDMAWSMSPSSQQEENQKPQRQTEVSSNKPCGGSKSCGSSASSCPHLKKLKDLRRNVFHMLSTFTPDLSYENGINCETEDVDELLYEVIYSNIDEECGAGNIANGAASKKD